MRTIRLLLIMILTGGTTFVSMILHFLSYCVTKNRKKIRKLKTGASLWKYLALEVTAI